MPEGSRILTIGTQDGSSIVMWAAVDTTLPDKHRKFLILGTGWNFEGELVSKYVGTVHMDNKCVWHIFDLGFDSEYKE